MLAKLKRYEAAIIAAREFVSENYLQHRFDAAMERILAPPPPETEDIPVTRWAIYEGEQFVGSVDDPKLAGPGQTLAKLTGSRTRVKAQEVTKTVKVRLVGNREVYWTTLDGTIATELNGKIGVFTYPVPPCS